MIDLKQYGYNENNLSPSSIGEGEKNIAGETGASGTGLLPARITAVHRERYELVCRNGAQFGKLKTSVYYGRDEQVFPTVGDFVIISEVRGGDSLIVETLPRRSYFARLDPDPVGGKQQAVAANFDYVFIMTSLNQDFKLNRIERYLVLSRRSGAVPVVILTKADLAADAGEIVSQVQDFAHDVDIIPVSVISGMGLDRLGKYLAPAKTAVFLGMSGVGKSSLLNALMGQDVMEVNTIREDDSRGRHTTTRRQLFTLSSGAMVIDTPGMRSLGMWEAEDGLSETFSDIEVLLGTCRFSDCTHSTEPGCAVNAAIENGELPASRLENYLSLKRESAYAENRAAFLRKKQARNKAIAQFSKHFSKKTRNGEF